MTAGRSLVDCGSVCLFGEAGGDSFFLFANDSAETNHEALRTWSGGVFVEIDQKVFQSSQGPTVLEGNPSNGKKGLLSWLCS